MSIYNEDCDIFEYSLSTIKKIGPLLTELENQNFNNLVNEDEIKITKRQAELLLFLQDLPTPPSLRELSRLLMTSHQNIKTICLNLEEKNLIQIKPDSKDRRKFRIKLTYEGDKKAYNLSKTTINLAKKVIEKFNSREIDELSRLIRKLEKSISEEILNSSKTKNN